MRNLLLILVFLAAALPAVLLANVSGNIAATPTSQALYYDATCGDYSCASRMSGGLSVNYSSLNAASIQSVYIYWTASSPNGNYCTLMYMQDAGSPGIWSGTNLSGVGTVTLTSASVNLYPDRAALGTKCTYTVSNPYVVVTYTPKNAAPVTVSSSGLPADFNISTEQTIVATVRDADGYANISAFHVLLNYGVDGAYACYLLVYPNSNSVYLNDDGGGTWGGGATFGAASTLANSSCRVNAATSSRSVSGTDATATFKITFLPGVFSRPSRPISAVNSYLYVTDNAGATAGWNGPYQTSTARSGPKLIVTSQR